MKFSPLLDQLYIHEELFSELFQYHVADGRFGNINLPEDVFVTKWGIFWFDSQRAHDRFSEGVRELGYEAISGRDELREQGDGYVVISDYPGVRLRELIGVSSP
jgi:hypothetical protein